MDLLLRWTKIGGVILVTLCLLLLSGSDGGVQRTLWDEANVSVTASPAERVAALWALSGDALADLETQLPLESDADYWKRYTLTRQFMLEVAWFESIQLQHRRQIRGPARSFYQIEPIRALSCCRMAQEQGWLDELARACHVSEVELADSCEGLTTTHWPERSLVERCLVENDRFATYMARVCLAPILRHMPDDPAEQAELWARRWKRAFASDQQRQEQKQAFITATQSLSPLLPESGPVP